MERAQTNRKNALAVSNNTSFREESQAEFKSNYHESSLSKARNTVSDVDLAILKVK
jgi:hypothetical protein